MDVDDAYEGMSKRFNRKRELHQRAHTLYKNRNMKIFTIPLMVVQFLNAILPQIAQAQPGLEKVMSIVTSSLAALSAIWLGFSANKRYAERSEGHKNAASIYQHLAVLTWAEKQRAKMMNDDDEQKTQKFLTFQDMVQNLEGKAKDDENLVPVRIVKGYKRERQIEKEEKEARESEREELIKKSDENEKKMESLENVPTLPAIMYNLPSTEDEKEKTEENVPTLPAIMYNLPSTEDEKEKTEQNVP